MKEDVLDENFNSDGINQISDRVLCEIKISQKKYPKKVLEFVNQEIKKRNLVIRNYKSIFDRSNEPKVRVINWVKNNPKNSILTLFTALIAGTTGFLIVLFSVYSSIQTNNLIKRRIWRIANLLITLLIIGTMILSFTIN